MTSRNDSGLISSSDLTGIVDSLPSFVAEAQRKEKESFYKPCDFIAPVKGFFDFMSRNSERFLRSDNCVRDFVYTAVLGAWHVGYGIGLYLGISKLLE